jgi:ABC-type microcin C transport system permease subunit YejB
MAETVRELIHAVEKAEAEAQKEEEVINQANISEEDREFIRSQLREIVERIKIKYGLNIPVTKRFLRGMLEVSV